MNGQKLRDYRKAFGMTQSDLAADLNEALGVKSYTKVLISYIENGTVDLPENAKSYLASKMTEKAVRTGSDERKDGEWVIMPRSEKKTLKSSIAEDVLDRLQNHSINNPFVAKDYARVIGVNEVAVRAAIRELRLNHIRICSDPRHRGYWLEENGGGYEITRSQMLSRAFRIFEVVKAMDNAQDGQMEWVEELTSTAEYGMRQGSCQA